MDKFKTCQGCPDRSLSCRAECFGWKYREVLKFERYNANAIKSAAQYQSAYLAKLINMRDREAQRRGRR